MFLRRKTGAGPADWVIAGLGNPGARYERTRHNVGFWALDALSKMWGIPVKKTGFHALYGLGAAGETRVLLIKPQTFMNRSGEALRDCLAYYKLPPTRLVVVYDDVSLPPGRIRVRGQGSDGGHNGLKSILYHCRSDAFPRVKIGVGAPPRPDFDLADWVLGGFAEADLPVVGEAVARACAAVAEILRGGTESAMNRYNAAEPTAGQGAAQKNR
ncbi:MAG: aminoacyl-tRNA hydrolase [Oscillospiraceae bacterium]|jgi:PTH1 family peptidyl-tRNA hydrolase|nr:aminoacyl-tRNA hydrolase [Oscillospiraceae bacterium]